MLDRAAIGQVLPPVTATVGHGSLRFFLNAIGETSPIHHDAVAAQAAGYRDCPIPPTYLFCLRMLDAPPYALIDERGALSALCCMEEQSFIYHEPVGGWRRDPLHRPDRRHLRPQGRRARIPGRGDPVRVERVSDGAHVADVRQVTVIRNPVAGMCGMSGELIRVVVRRCRRSPARS